MLTASHSIASHSSHRRLAMRDSPCLRPRKSMRNNAFFVEERRRGGVRLQNSDFGIWGSSPIDVLGVGQAMVDINATVQDHILEQLALPKGGRRVLGSIEERSTVLATLGDEDCPTKLSAGGSLANSLVTIGQLNRAAAVATANTGNTMGDTRGLSVSMGGSCGGDHLGRYFAAQMGRSGVSVDNKQGGPTGTVIVLTDGTGERSFLTYFGDSSDLRVTPKLKHGVSQANLVIIEGYLWEMPGALESIKCIVSVAHMSGAQVALTAGDPGVVQRHLRNILEIIAMGVDILFCNRAEAIQLLGGKVQHSGQAAAEQLAMMVGTAVVTDGADGSCVGSLGRVYQVQPAEAPGGVVVSTNGAGDAYCGGFLFALAQGCGLLDAAGFASRVAATVVSRHHAQLSEEDAAALVGLLPVKPVVPSALMPGAFTCV